jgi:hypothetical protein
VDTGQAAAAAAEGLRARGDVTWLHILTLNWRLCVAVFLTYCVTLSIFPGFLAGEGQTCGLCLCWAPHPMCWGCAGAVWASVSLQQISDPQSG